MIKNIKLIVSEFDGILTDGNALIDNIGLCIGKNVNIGDLEVINMLKKEVIFVFLSSNSYVSYNFSREKNIPFYFCNKNRTKYDTLINIMNRYSVTSDEIICIGSKISDEPVAKVAKYAFCPKGNILYTYLNIGNKVKELGVISGNGVISWFFTNVWRFGNVD